MKKYSKNAVLAVAEQLVNMITNNILEENGGESFTGWLQDGEVFELNGCTEEEVAERMEFANLIAEKVNELTWEFDKQLNHQELL